MEGKAVIHEIKKFDMLIYKKLSCKNFLDNKKDIKMPTVAQMQILEYILEHENENIYQKDLENVFKVSRATLSGVLQTMEKYQLIDRVIDTNDTRTKKIILNKKAKEIFEEKKKKFADVENIILKDIKKEELESFFKLLEKMKINLLNTME